MGLGQCGGGTWRTGGRGTCDEVVLYENRVCFQLKKNSHHQNET